MRSSAVKRSQEKKRLGRKKSKQGRAGVEREGRCREEVKPSGRQRKVPAQQPCSRWKRAEGSRERPPVGNGAEEPLTVCSFEE